MKKAIAILILPVLLLSSASLTGCKNKKINNEQKKVEVQAVDTIKKNIEENVYPLPTSAEVIKMLTDLEVGYIFGISNPAENSKKYFSSTARSINMGVYGADLSYATLYNIQQSVIDYMDAIRNLANELNMSKIYDASLYDKIKQNFDNKDELVKILTGAFNDTYNYLADNDQQPLALLVVGVAKNLLEQKKSFELFLEITKPYENDPIVSDFVKALDPVKKVYDGLGTSLTEQNIKDITKAIEEVRGQIIK